MVDSMSIFDALYSKSTLYTSYRVAIRRREARNDPCLKLQRGKLCLNGEITKHYLLKEQQVYYVPGKEL